MNHAIIEVKRKAKGQGSINRFYVVEKVNVEFRVEKEQTIFTTTGLKVINDDVFEFSIIRTYDGSLIHNDDECDKYYKKELAPLDTLIFAGLGHESDAEDLGFDD